MLLVLLKGHPGCGKSTLGRAVARHLRCPLVDKDDPRDAASALAASGVPAGARSLVRSAPRRRRSLGPSSLDAS